MKDDSLKITICGDICPTKDTYEYFNSGDVNKIFNNTVEVLNKSDILIANLEFPLITGGKDAVKTGPVLKGDNHFIDIFTKMEFNALSLANNHIKDCGEEGVLNTLKVCKESNILTFGAGINETEAKKPLIIEKKGKKIGFISFAEHEFNAAYSNEAGANLLDVYSDFDFIKKVKKEVDYLIVLYHGGIEYFAYPSLLLQKKCRKLIESGADFVTCQHSHVIGTEEDYLHGKILYGQGNTVFGYRPNSSTWNEGLIVNINLVEDNISIDYIPIKATEYGVFLMSEKEKDIVFSKMNKRKLNVKNTAFLEEKWIAFCNENKSLYLPLVLGKGRIFNKLNRILDNKLIRFFYSKKKAIITQNIVRCESHNEVISTIYNNYVK